MQNMGVKSATFIGNANPRSAAKLHGQPILPMLVPFVIACFTGAFVTDLIYWQSVDVMWETFSDWLLTAGMTMAGLAIIALVIDLAVGKQVRTLAWPRAVGYPIAVVLSLINAFVHSRDGYTAVVPTGLTLSALVVIMMIVAALAKRPSFARQSGA